MMAIPEEATSGAITNAQTKKVDWGKTKLETTEFAIFHL
jgi:hypothetical protein